MAIFRKLSAGSDSELDEKEPSPYLRRKGKFTGSISSSCSALSTSSGMRHSFTDDDGMHSDVSMESKATIPSIATKV